jgi:hypothetical protein
MHDIGCSLRPGHQTLQKHLAICHRGAQSRRRPCDVVALVRSDGHGQRSPPLCSATCAVRAWPRCTVVVTDPASDSCLRIRILDLAPRPAGEERGESLRNGVRRALDRKRPMLV